MGIFRQQWSNSLQLDIIMARSTASLVFLFSCLFASSLCQAGEDDGQWKDDVSGNPEVMGFVDPSEQQMQFAEPIQVPVPMQAAPEFFEPSNDDDQSGAWMDDVSNNQIAMGEDPLSQDPGLGNTHLKSFFLLHA